MCSVVIEGSSPAITHDPSLLEPLAQAVQSWAMSGVVDRHCTRPPAIDLANLEASFLPLSKCCCQGIPRVAHTRILSWDCHTPFFALTRKLCTGSVATAQG